MRPFRLALLWLPVMIACGQPAPRPTLGVVKAEIERRQRLPEDERTLDGKWHNVSISLSHNNDKTWAVLEMRSPKFRYFYRPFDPPQERDKKPKSNATANAEASQAVPDLLARLAPVDIDRIEIHDGELVFVDMSKPEKPEIWISELEVSIENVATRATLAEGRPVLISARGKVQRSGEMAVFITADPWSGELNFSGRASVEGLATKELYAFLADAVKLQAPQGSVDLYVAFEVKKGEIVGGVKPLLKNVKLRPVNAGVFSRVKAWVANRVMGLFSDRVAGRTAVATVIPIKGKLTGAKPQLWPALTGVLYNAYITGISGGFGGVPDEKSNQPHHASTSDGRPVAQGGEGRGAR